jgi:hypothetical protein
VASVCHVVLVTGAGRSAPLMSIVMVALVAACVRCSLSFWKSPSDRSATSMLVVAASMLIAHSVLAGFGHVHGVSKATTAIGTGETTPSAFLDVINFGASVLEIVVVLRLAFWLRSIHRKPVVADRCPDDAGNSCDQGDGLHSSLRTKPHALPYAELSGNTVDWKLSNTRQINNRGLN